MKLFFIAGEASGDQHASVVIKSIKKKYPEVEIICWGGDLMQSAGATLLSHYKNRAIMGFIEVIRKIRTIKSYLNKAKKDIIKESPDVLILVDNPGFNMPLAKFAKQKGIKVFWYIAPKVWAWNEKRVKSLKKYVDELFVIFPFEIDYFKKHDINAHFVGNPSFQAVKSFESSQSDPFYSQKTIALLPGSRKSEVSSLLPIFLKTVQKIEPVNVKIIIAGAPGLNTQFYQEILDQHQLSSEVKFGETFNILNTCRQTDGYALVASGTATLETALFEVPQIVAYKVNPLTYWLGKTLVGIKFVSLVNILLKRELIEEHLQKVNAETLREAIARLEDNKSQITNGYKELKSILEVDNKSIVDLIMEKS